jgi:hypothetical protein
MHIARQTPQELVVVARSRWVSALCAAAALFTLYFVIVRQKPQGYFVVVFLLFFAVIMNLSKTFTFDATHRVVRWKGWKAFKSESGEVPFDDISDIGTESRRAGNRDVPAYRLTIVTPQGSVPMAYVFSGHPDGYAELRRQILEFVQPSSMVKSI